MIKIFGSGDTSFATNGDKVISPFLAKVKCELNGSYHLDLECGIEYSDYIENGNLVVVPTPDGEQAFRITKPIKTNRRIKTKAYHISFDTDRYVINNVQITNSNCGGALASASAGCDQPNPFTFISDINTAHSLKLTRVTLTKALELITNLWQGEIKRDNLSISVLGNIGQDRGVTIAYGKNLTGIQATYDWSNVCTKILPIGKDETTLDSVYLISETQYALPYTKVVQFEQSIERSSYATDEEYITALKNDLRAKATAYMNANSVPQVNYVVSTIPIQEVKLGDTVAVEDDNIGVHIEARVISYEWDAINEKYTQLEYGNFKKKLSDLMSNVDNKIETATTISGQNITTNYERAIAEATEAIHQGMVNSYVIYEGNRILVVDALPKETAQNVILINSAGIAFSQTGINGTFSTVWQINGTFDARNANFINLTADLIQGGTLSLGRGQNVSGVLKLYDATDTLICEMDNTGFTMYGTDGSKIKINQQDGLVGYDADNNRIYWVAEDVFHMNKAEVASEITLSGMLRFIPMEIYSGGALQSKGIGLVALEE